MKLLAGHDEELWHIIPLLLGCKKENSKEGNFIEIDEVRNIVDLMKETAFSHLMEVSGQSTRLNYVCINVYLNLKSHTFFCDTNGQKTPGFYAFRFSIKARGPANCFLISPFVNF